MPFIPSASQIQATYQMLGGSMFAAQYTYDGASTADADPGAGKFRMNSTAGFPTNVTHMYVNNLGANGEDFGSWINNSLGTLLANGMTPTIRFQSLSQPTKWADYYVLNYNVGAQYTDLTVSFISANGYPPNGVTKDVLFTFGAGGGQAGPVWLFDGTTTSLSGVGTGFFRMNGNLRTSTKIGVNGTTRNMQDWSGLFPFLNLTSGPVKARLILLNLATLGGGISTNFAMYEINAFVLHSGDYEEFQITYVDTTDTGGNYPLVTFDPVVFFFQWVGVGAKYNPTAVVTSTGSPYSASVNEMVKVDSSGGVVTVNLPNAPSNGSCVLVKNVVYGSNVTIAGQGSDVFNVAGGPTSLTLSAVNTGYELQYQTSGAIWNVIGSIGP